MIATPSTGGPGPHEAAPPGTARAAGGSRTAAAAYEVLSRLRPLYQSSGRAVDQALQGVDLTVPLRAVLELLIDQGSMTVPDTAREFGVTRQSVQALVDTGAARGLLVLEDNPHHKRSRLVAVTERGRRLFAEVHRRELENLDRVTSDLDADDLLLCAQVLTTLTARVRRLHHDQELT